MADSRRKPTKSHPPTNPLVVLAAALVVVLVAIAVAYALSSSDGAPPLLPWSLSPVGFAWFLAVPAIVRPSSSRRLTVRSRSPPSSRSSAR